ncbi:MAG TPA: hypothetical protein VGO08_10000 [Burkholderiales bacterium]|nr:hypothetical protein [Burkholderiales bacterium]
MFKVTLLALLCANTAYFAIGGSISKALDAAAWLTLLLLFEAETQFATQVRSKRQRATVRTLRLAAAAGVVAATIGYVLEDDILDALNSAVWIAVVVLLEIQMRFRDHVQRARLAFAAVAASLYGALALLVVIWASRGQWFDAYDALLWLVAFGALELDLTIGKTSADAPLTSR